MTETIENKKKRKTNSSKNNQTKKNHNTNNKNTNKNYHSKKHVQNQNNSTKKKTVKPIETESNLIEINKETELKPLNEIPKINKSNKIEKAKNILGMDLPEGNTKSDKKERIKIYTKDAIIFSLIAPVIDLLGMLFLKKYNYVMITNNNMINYLFTVLIDFIIIFIVTFCIDYFAGERAVNNKK